MIQQRNGHTGEAHGFAANLAKAKRILWPAAQEPPTPHRCRRRTPFAPTPDGTAPHQHRAPPTTGSGRSQPRRSPERCRRPRPGEASADRPLALRSALCRKGQESAAPSTDPAR
ncbi:hypothetical protein ACFU9O_08640 [Streptomyces albidoflavus]